MFEVTWSDGNNYEVLEFRCLDVENVIQDWRQSGKPTAWILKIERIPFRPQS